MTAVPSMTGMIAGWYVTARRGVLTIGMSNAMNATFTKAAMQTHLNTMAGGSENAPFALNVRTTNAVGKHPMITHSVTVAKLRRIMWDAYL